MATTYLPGAVRPANPTRRVITTAGLTPSFGRTPKLEAGRPAAPRVVQDHTNIAAASAAIASRLGGAA